MIKVRVPATSANLGPGFDSVGLAVNLYNEFYFYRINREEPPQGCVFLHDKSLVHCAMRLLARTAGQQAPSAGVAVRAGIPRARGLGSSAALTVAGLAAANRILGTNMDGMTLVNLAAQLEGHPDNAAPALLGGLVISMTTPEGFKCLKIMPQKPLRVVVAVPEFELSTSAARRVLPQMTPHRDAVQNTGRFGFFVAALLTGDYRCLSLAMDDLLHQPYRLGLVPGMKEVMEAALQAGALGCCLSGAGPSILAFCGEKCAEVSAAMKKTWEDSGIRTATHILDIDDAGTTLEEI